MKKEEISLLLSYLEPFLTSLNFKQQQSNLGEGNLFLEGRLRLEAHRLSAFSD
jgi:hypothetical protein